MKHVWLLYSPWPGIDVTTKQNHIAATVFACVYTGGLHKNDPKIQVQRTNIMHNHLASSHGLSNIKKTVLLLW